MQIIDEIQRLLNEADDPEIAAVLSRCYTELHKLRKDTLEDFGVCYAAVDGACAGNPGTGGWAFVIHKDDRILAKESGCVGFNATNNQMELMAAIKALLRIGRGGRIVVVTDSKYVKDGITKWINRWKGNGWKTSRGKPVKNLAHWQKLDSLCQSRDVTWEWTPGHSGHRWNEMADEMAREAING